MSRWDKPLEWFPHMVIMMVVAVAMVLLLGGCKTTQPDLQPEIVIKEVLVATPVPCRALEALGAEPVYPDTDAAIATAPNVATRAKLYVQGRTMRIQRLAEYLVARASCEF